MKSGGYQNSISVELSCAILPSLNSAVRSTSMNPMCFTCTALPREMEVNIDYGCKVHRLNYPANVHNSIGLRIGSRIDPDKSRSVYIGGSIPIRPFTASRIFCLQPR